MPKQKDLKRLIRSRMKKTAEAYTAARLQLLKKSEPTTRYAEVAGMSDDAVNRRTGRTWAQWVRVLDAVREPEKTHREIAQHVSSLGTPDWWSQTVTVGYERIRGLRDRGQRRGGGMKRPRAARSTFRSRSSSTPSRMRAFAAGGSPRRLRCAMPPRTNTCG